jgi:hypothetical protein
VAHDLHGAGLHHVDQLSLVPLGEDPLAVDELTELVRPEGDDDRRTLRMDDHRVEEARPLPGVEAAGEGLLELVDDEHGRAGAATGRTLVQRDELLERSRTGRDEQHVVAGGAERRDDAGAHEGGLAGPGRADDREHAGRIESFVAGPDVRLPAEEAVGVDVLRYSMSLVRDSR